MLARSLPHEGAHLYHDALTLASRAYTMAVNAAEIGATVDMNHAEAIYQSAMAAANWHYAVAMSWADGSLYLAEATAQALHQERQVQAEVAYDNARALAVYDGHHSREDAYVAWVEGMAQAAYDLSLSPDRYYPQYGYGYWNYPYYSGYGGWYGGYGMGYYGYGYGGWYGYGGYGYGGWYGGWYGDGGYSYSPYYGMGWAGYGWPYYGGYYGGYYGLGGYYGYYGLGGYYGGYYGLGYYGYYGGYYDAFGYNNWLGYYGGYYGWLGYYGWGWGGYGYSSQDVWTQAWDTYREAVDTANETQTDSLDAAKLAHVTAVGDAQIQRATSLGDAGVKLATDRASAGVAYVAATNWAETNYVNALSSAEIQLAWNQANIGVAQATNYALAAQHQTNAQGQADVAFQERKGIADVALAAAVATAEADYQIAVVRNDAEQAFALAALDAVPGDTLAAGLIAAWSAQEGQSGGTWSEPISGLDAELHGPAWADTPHGAALVFDGTSDYAAIENATALQTQSKTIAFWAKPQGAISETAIVLGNGSDNWYVGFGLDNTLVASHTASDGTQRLTVSAADVARPDQWAHYAFTWDVIGSDVTVRMYVNAGLVLEATYADDYGVIPASTFYLGSHDGTQSFFKGSLAQLRVWGRPLALEELSLSHERYYDALFQAARLEWVEGMKPAFVSRVTHAAQANAEAAKLLTIAQTGFGNSTAIADVAYAGHAADFAATRYFQTVTVIGSYAEQGTTIDNVRSAAGAATGRDYAIALAAVEKTFAVAWATAEKQYQIDLANDVDGGYEDVKAARADAELRKATDLADAKFAWQQREIAAQKANSIAAAVRERWYSDSLAGIQREHVADLASAQRGLEAAYGKARTTYQETETAADNALRSDLAAVDLAYWAEEDAWSQSASATLNTSLSIPWTEYLVDRAGTRQGWWGSVQSDYSQWISDSNSVQSTYRTTVSADYLTTIAVLGSSALDALLSKVTAIETRDLDQAAAQEAYVLALSGSAGNSGPAEVYGLAVAQADRDHAIAVATAKRDYAVDNDYQAYQVALDQASAAKNDSLQAAKRDYAAAESDAVATRMVAFETAQSGFSAEMLIANVGDVSTRAAAKKAHITAESNANRTKTVDGLQLNHAFWDHQASTYASEMTDFATANGTPWAAYDAAEAVNLDTWVSSSGLAYLEHETTRAEELNGYESASADSNEAKTNAETAAGADDVSRVMEARLARVVNEALAIAGMGASGSPLEPFPAVPQPENVGARYSVRTAPASDYWQSTYYYGYGWSPYASWGGYDAYYGWYGYPGYYSYAYYNAYAGSGYLPDPPALDLGDISRGTETASRSYWDLSGELKQGLAESSPNMAADAVFAELGSDFSEGGFAQLAALMTERTGESGDRPSTPYEACFPAGTPILTKGGFKPIEEVQAGDFVLAAEQHDPEGSVDVIQVSRTFRNGPGELVSIQVSGQVMRATLNHPVYVRGKGFTRAVDVRISDELRTNTGGWVRVERISRSGEIEPVYNIEVPGHHTYFVGKAAWGFGVLVHNQSSMDDVCMEVSLLFARVIGRFESAATETGSKYYTIMAESYTLESKTFDTKWYLGKITEDDIRKAVDSISRGMASLDRAEELAARVRHINAATQLIADRIIAERKRQANSLTGSEYWDDAVATTFVGERAKRPTNVGGVGGSVVFGFTGLDFYKDVSDLIFGFENWEGTWEDWKTLGWNIGALAPVIGAIKYLKHADALKHLDKVPVKQLDEMAEVGVRVTRGSMVIETGSLLDGSKFREFVIYAHDGLDRFAARLIEGSKTLEVSWTDNIPRTLLRLHEAQQLAGGRGAFTKITGKASFQLETAIRTGTFDTDEAAKLLGRSLGGYWKIEVTKRESGLYDIIATLLN